MSPTQIIKRRTLQLILSIGLASLLCTSPAFTHNLTPQYEEEIEPVDYHQSKAVNSFIDYMVDTHGFKRSELELIFDQVEFNSKSLQLIKPAPVTKPKNWSAYRARFIDPIRIQAGVKFWNKYEDALIRAEKQYGVPAQIIVGIIGIETVFGRNVGTFRVVDVLATLGFAYPATPNRDTRMEYFRGELEHVLLFARESGIDPFSLRGSYAGAIGWPQFMPSSIRQYAVDYEDKGKIDLRNSPVDAIGSVANFLSKHGWEQGLPLVFPAKIINDHPETMLATELTAASTLQQLADVAVPTKEDMPTQLLYGLIDLQNGTDPTEYWFATQNFFAITKYNRSYFYAMSVIELGKAVCVARNLTDSCDFEQYSHQ
jgi:membrane-bound lytic murein transglycosylase B